MYDEAKEMDVMTNKTQNMFREGKKRLSAKEQMIKFQQRKCDGTFSNGRNDRVQLGLYGLLQVTFIYCTYYMEDGSSILDNIV